MQRPGRGTTEQYIIHRTVKPCFYNEQLPVQQHKLPTNRWYSHGDQSGTIICQHPYEKLWRQIIIIATISIPLVWYHYIEDVFCMWQHSETELNKFVRYLNNFLDTLVKLNDGTKSTDLYCKPTDRNNYLPCDSAHHPHCKKGLPYDQFLRLRGTCSRDKESSTPPAKEISYDRTDGSKGKGEVGTP